LFDTGAFVGRQKRMKETVMLRKAYSYGCVMAPLPEGAAARIREIAAAIPDEDIYESEDGEHGREDDVHVTVKYGLHTSDHEEVRKALQGFGPVRATLRRLTAFHAPDFVVLKVSVESEDLIRLNRLVCDSFEFTDSHPEYRPHATVAYLRHRPADPYWYKAAFAGPGLDMDVVIDELEFSDAGGRHTFFDLSGKREAASAKVASLFQIDESRERGRLYMEELKRSDPEEAARLERAIATYNSREQMARRVATATMVATRAR